MMSEDQQVKPSVSESGQVKPSSSESGQVKPIVSESGQVKPSVLVSAQVSPSVADRGQVDEPGVAKIKSEFLLLDYKPKVDTEYVSDKVKAQLKETDAAEKSQEDSGEPPSKRVKLTGRNKKRPKGKRVDASEKICQAIIRDQTCSYGNTCKFSHDKQNFMDTKPPDISDQCYMFNNYGKCTFGLACRFGSSHVTSDLKNVVKEDFDETRLRAAVKNVLKKENQVLLWKRKYDFTKADEIIDKMGCRNPKEKGGKDRKGKGKEKPVGSDLKPEMDKSVGDLKNITESSENTTNVSASLSDTKIDSKGDTATNESNENTEHIHSEKEEVNESSLTTLTASSQGNGSKILTGPESSIADNVNDDNGTENQGVLSNKADSSNTISQSSDLGLHKIKGDYKGTSSQSNIVSFSSAANGAVASHTDTDLHGDEMKYNEGVIHLRPQEKKKVNFADKLYLAPLTTVGNLPYRRICKRLGADVTCGEMAVATNLLQGQASEWALLKRHESEDLFGVQICGAYPDTMTRCAQIINDTLDVDFVDINCGCPIDLIFNKGEGSALMGRVTKFGQIVEGMTSVLDVPLTVKVRTGIYSDKNIAHTLMPKLRDWGVALATVHGRSRVQRYTKTADWDYISECAKQAAPMPVFGNGDIMSFIEANERREQTGVSGIMIARGALIKPWIFTEIKEQRHWDISANERFDILREYTNYGLEHWGSDHQGVESTRRFLLEWLSFLYRYIPVGLLERLPQKINERPPYYRGRNDLETLLTSPNCGDWIKISEMLLGPVPEGFSFLPKHKANAYK